MSDKRIYTDKEISAVLKRATELQGAQGPAGGTSGLSLDELEQIAAEVGIDPNYVKAAALELEEGRTDTSYSMIKFFILDKELSVYLSIRQHA